MTHHPADQGRAVGDAGEDGVALWRFATVDGAITYRTYRPTIVVPAEPGHWFPDSHPLAERLRAAEGERDELQGHLDATIDQWNHSHARIEAEHEDAITALEAQLATLRGVVERFARHDEKCDLFRQASRSLTRCTCGLDAALDALSDQEAGDA